eukprot:CAMPEP_0197189170 /NCGR_PEP_ID=MMETSP1423-20130617/19292_1 /TAXON_ID=476441 /ORGANISM="Pseudo-nitzschia heimii, Strain UNC1101" /LENGTH=179 /DNA_ID=CAMNT_0042641217 /DNA_START=48 /DNA_END=584 /DNA_ORIENTATION=-
MSVTNDSALLDVNDDGSTKSDASDLSTKAKNVVSSNSGNDVGATIELEENMKSLIEATKTNGIIAGSETTDEMEISRDSSSMELKDNTTQSECFTEDLNNAIRVSGNEDEKTIELEGNMLSLLENTTEKACVMDRNYLETKEDTKESENFTGNLYNTIRKSGTETDRTGKFEGNILSLL